VGTIVPGLPVEEAVIFCKREEGGRVRKLVDDCDGSNANFEQKCS
jgi:hypothetical protein